MLIGLRRSGWGGVQRPIFVIYGVLVNRGDKRDRGEPGNDDFYVWGGIGDEVRGEGGIFEVGIVWDFSCGFWRNGGSIEGCGYLVSKEEEEEERREKRRWSQGRRWGAV